MLSFSNIARAEPFETLYLCSSAEQGVFIQRCYSRCQKCFYVVPVRSALSISLDVIVCSLRHKIANMGSYYGHILAVV